MAWKLFHRKHKHRNESWNQKTMFGPNTSFAVKEAYKLLRTNLMFSFSDEGRGHVIGFTSAIQDEGKSSSACNTAYALSEAGKKVLLLEADLRRPSVPSKLGIARVPGLTNLLVSRWEYKEVIQHCAVAPNLDIIASGDIPPNPSELLASNRMEQLMQELTRDYDYVVVDLPPVTVVSDAVAVSKVLDGVVVIVRGDVSDRKMLAEAIRLLNLVNVRILGLVFRDSAAGSLRYGSYKKKYRSKYYREYSKRKETK